MKDVLSQYFFDQLVGFYGNNYSSRPNGLRVNSPWGLRCHGLLTQRARGIIDKYLPVAERPPIAPAVAGIGLGGGG